MSNTAGGAKTYQIDDPYHGAFLVDGILGKHLVAELRDGDEALPLNPPRGRRR